MFGIGGTELVIIALFALVIFGPDKLPSIARTVGRTLGQFKRAQQDMERLIRAEMYVSDTKRVEEERAAKAASDAEASATAQARTAAETSEAVERATSIWDETSEPEEGAES